MWSLLLIDWEHPSSRAWCSGIPANGKCVIGTPMDRASAAGKIGCRTRGPFCRVRMFTSYESLSHMRSKSTLRQSHKYRMTNKMVRQL